MGKTHLVVSNCLADSIAVIDVAVSDASRYISVNNTWLASAYNRCCSNGCSGYTYCKTWACKWVPSPAVVPMTPAVPVMPMSATTVWMPMTATTMATVMTTATMATVCESTAGYQ